MHNLKLHKHSCSQRTIPRAKTEHTAPPSKPSLKLPQLQLKHSNNSHNSVLTSLSPRPHAQSRLNPMLLFQYQELCAEIHDKMELLKMIKENAEACKDNALMKKIKGEIEYMGQAKVVAEIWNNPNLYQQCQVDDLLRLEQIYQVKINMEVIRSLKYLSNFCRYHLAEYKKKQWAEKQMTIARQMSKLNTKMHHIRHNLQHLDNPETKLQLLASLAGVRPQCTAKKQHYMEWRDKAMQKLKSSKINCEILRAQVFTEGLF